MSSVYVPPHVVVLFRRFVNVISTLSISSQYVSYTCGKTADDAAPQRLSRVNALKESGILTSKHSFDYFRNIEWPWWAHRSSWSDISLRAGEVPEIQATAGMDGGMVLRAALTLPRWITGNWEPPRLFSSHQQEVNRPRYDDTPPPSHGNREEPPRKLQSRDRFRPPSKGDDIIHQLLMSPALFDPVRTPRYPIVLCHGLYGFDSRGPHSFPSMRMHYWSNVLNILRGKVGADVIVTSVPGTGSIASRAARLDEQLQSRARGRGINFLAHSMGGLDCRHLISNIQPREYAPLSLTTISTPHRGSPFMDWCASNIGIGKLRQQEKDFEAATKRTRQDVEGFSAEIASEDKPKSQTRGDTSFPLSLSSLPSSFTTLILSVVDSPAYANLTSNYLNDVFNPATPDDPRVKYWSVAGRMSADSVSVWHPFWLPKMVLDGVEEKERERLKQIWEQQNVLKEAQQWGKGQTPLWADEPQWGNDGLVTVQSAKWGEFLGTMEGCDHWEMRGARGIEFGVDIPAIPAIGLGSLPLASSLSNFRRPNNSLAAAVQGDGWGFGDWTRFVGAWKKSKDESDAAADKAGTVPKNHGHRLEDQKEHDEKLNQVVASSLSTPSIPPSSPRTQETKQEKRKREQLADDHIIKSTTETLSIVFDWLIERVPTAPKVILGRPSELNEKETQTAIGSAANTQNDTLSGTTFRETNIAAAKAIDELKDFSAAAVTHAVGVGASPTEAPALSSPTPPSEMKRRMEREDKNRKRVKELASKDDLERFYVALSRKMYDEGL